MHETELNLKDTYFVPLLSTLEVYTGPPEGATSATGCPVLSAPLRHLNLEPRVCPSGYLGTWASLAPLRVTVLVYLSFIFTFFLLHLPVGHCQLGSPTRL